MARRKKPRKPLPTIGWREWLALPAFGVERIKAKVDTGAKTSSLHAFEITPFERDGEPWVRFLIHPLQRSEADTLEVSAPLVDERKVKPSTGRASLRPVVRTEVKLGDDAWPIEITLVNRDVMGFRMLLGRSAIRRRYLVDPGRSFLGGEPV